MNIFLDIDDVIFTFQQDYAKYFNVPVPKKWLSNKTIISHLSILQKNRDFWLNLGLKNYPDFIPKGYVSARSIPKSWTIESLRKKNLPNFTKICQLDWGESKVDILKSLKCDLFIDDKVKTFKELNKAGIFCLLMDAPHNQHIKTPFRIYTLNIDNILYLWRKLR